MEFVLCNADSVGMRQTRLAVPLLEVAGKSQQKPVGSPVDDANMVFRIHQELLSSEEDAVYSSLTRSLRYLATYTRLDPSAVVSMHGPHVATPYQVHMLMAREASRYLLGPSNSVQIRSRGHGKEVMVF